MIIYIPSWLLKALLSAFLSIPLVLISGYFYYPEVLVMDHRIIKSNYSFLYEHWKEPKLAQLWSQENFKYINANNQMEYFIKLCDWTHRQWKFGSPNPYPLCNALDILRDIRSGKTGGFCGQYAYVLADILKSCGFYNVRYVEAVSADGGGHFSVEVWSDDFGKWVLLGPTSDVYYVLEKSGVPANAYEVRRSLLGGEKVMVVAIDGHFISEDEQEVLLDRYRDFAVSLRSDLMRSPKPLNNRDRLDMFLELRDGNNSPYYRTKVKYRNATSDVRDIYYDCDKVHVDFTRSHNHVGLSLSSEGETPNFMGFVYRIGEDPSWHSCGPDLVVTRTSGMETVYLTTENQFGRIGTSNRVEIRW